MSAPVAPQPVAPPTPVRTSPRQLLLIRVVVVLTAVTGLNYVVWRWLFSVNWDAWWIAVPLILAETYSLVDSLLFGMTMWRLRDRGEPPPAPEGLTVDVFITTYNEPLELVMATARAARDIRYPHTTWVLDDGNRAELRELAEAEGIGWISRGPEWTPDKPRHAKAGNLNNALQRTHGEFLLILDADQIPRPEILDRTLGYFRDEQMALVQTPQWFVNVPESDPLGSQAPLFYGPIQQGKDGWNAAFFCGSNAIIRREALMRIGVARYVVELERRITLALSTADEVLARARENLAPDQQALDAALVQVGHEVRHARSELRRGLPLADVTLRFQRRVEAAARTVVEHDHRAMQADMAAIEELTGTIDATALERLTRRDWSPLGAIETVRALIAAVDLDRDDEAQPVMPMATISVTEDMATCMRLHGMGWRTAYHHEVLAIGLAPEDLGSMLTQRLRWAQGTMQVMFRENPLVQRGLSIPQRLMYFATMWSYLSGFTAVVYVAAPVIYLLVGVLPVQTISTEFFLRLVPFLVVNQLLFLVVARGTPTWRGQQYSLALFPIWIRAVTTAVGNVFRGRGLGFAVTPKTRQEADRPPWSLVATQLKVMALLVAAAIAGTIRILVGQGQLLGYATTLLWVLFDLAIFSVVVRAARYRGPDVPPFPLVPRRPARHQEESRS